MIAVLNCPFDDLIKNYFRSITFVKNVSEFNTSGLLFVESGSTLCMFVKIIFFLTHVFKEEMMGQVLVISGRQRRIGRIVPSICDGAPVI